MFFINERLTLEQRAEFNSWGIMQPFFGFGRVISEKPLKPRYWTVDTEREIYLLDTSYDGDYPDEHVFIFIWNKKDYRVQFYRRLEKDGVVVWELPKKYLIDSVFPYCEQEQFLDDLRDALTAYGFDGMPDEYNKICNTKFMF